MHWESSGEGMKMCHENPYKSSRWVHGPLPNFTCDMILCINAIRQLQSSYSLNAKATPIATQLRLTISS